MKMRPDGQSPWKISVLMSSVEISPLGRSDVFQCFIVVQNPPVDYISRLIH